MSVSSSTNRVDYIATSGQTEFAFDFKYFDETSIEVYQNEILLTTGYTITPDAEGKENGGTVSLSTGATAGDTITIKRVLPLIQDSVYEENTRFPPQVVEDDFDKGVMIDQQNQEELDRCIKVGPASLVTDVIIAEPTSALVGHALVVTEDTPDNFGFAYTSQDIDSIVNEVDSVIDEAQGYADAAGVSAGQSAASASASSASASASASSASAAATSAQEAEDAASSVNLPTITPADENKTLTVDDGGNWSLGSTLESDIPPAVSGQIVQGNSGATGMESISIAGQAGKVLSVNSGETGHEYVDLPSGGGLPYIVSPAGMINPDGTITSVTDNGTNYTVDFDLTGLNSVYVKMTAGGGSGSTGTGGANGGGAGACIECVVDVSSLGNTTMTIGKGGEAIASTSGDAGNSSSFGAEITCQGGLGGNPATGTPSYTTAPSVSGNVTSIRSVKGARALAKGTATDDIQIGMGNAIFAGDPPRTNFTSADYTTPPGAGGNHHETTNSTLRCPGGDGRIEITPLS